MVDIAQGMSVRGLGRVLLVGRREHLFLVNGQEPTEALAKVTRLTEKLTKQQRTSPARLSPRYPPTARTGRAGGRSSRSPTIGNFALLTFDMGEMDVKRLIGEK